MIKIESGENDDPTFVSIVETTLDNLIRMHPSTDIYLIKIDNWFDFKWYSFSGKALGLVGFRHKELRIPPFTPDRIAWQRYFIKTESHVVETEVKPLHIYQQSDANFLRKIKLISDSAIFLWFSGNSKTSSRGSMMLYGIRDGNEPSWYISLLKKESWQIFKTQDISKNEALAQIESVVL